MSADQSGTTVGGPADDTGLGRPIVQSADPIDRVVRLAPKWTQFVLGACGLVVAGIVIWAFTGTVTTSVSVAGLYNEAGASAVDATAPGRVDRVLVSLGQQVGAGQPVVSLAGGGVLTSPRAGAITSVLVSDGSNVVAGKTVVRVTDLAQPDTVVALVPANLTGTVSVGSPVRMSVSSAPPGQYGYLRGTVSQISFDPYTTAEIADRLGIQDQVVSSLLGAEPGLLAIVRLDYDPATVSHYRWSIGQGPPFVLTQGVPISVEVDLSEKHPIQVVFAG